MVVVLRGDVKHGRLPVLVPFDFHSRSNPPRTVKHYAYAKLRTNPERRRCCRNLG